MGCTSSNSVEANTKAPGSHPHSEGSWTTKILDYDDYIEMNHYAECSNGLESCPQKDYLEIETTPVFVVKTRRNSSNEKAFINVFRSDEVLHTLIEIQKFVIERNGEQSDLFNVLVKHKPSHLQEIANRDQVCKEMIEEINKKYQDCLNSEYVIPKINKGYIGTEKPPCFMVPKSCTRFRGSTTYHDINRYQSERTATNTTTTVHPFGSSSASSSHLPPMPPSDTSSTNTATDTTSILSPSSELSSEISSTSNRSSNKSKVSTHVKDGDNNVKASIAVGEQKSLPLVVETEEERIEHQVNNLLFSDNVDSGTISPTTTRKQREEDERIDQQVNDLLFEQNDEFSTQFYSTRFLKMGYCPSIVAETMEICKNDHIQAGTTLHKLTLASVGDTELDIGMLWAPTIIAKIVKYETNFQDLSENEKHTNFEVELTLKTFELNDIKKLKSFSSVIGDGQFVDDSTIINGPIIETEIVIRNYRFRQFFQLHTDLLAALGDREYAPLNALFPRDRIRQSITIFSAGKQAQMRQDKINAWLNKLCSDPIIFTNPAVFSLLETFFQLN